MMNTNTTTEKELTGYPSIDKPWLKYYEGRDINVPRSECTVYEYVYQHNKDYLAHTALEYFGTKIRYKKLFEQVDLCAKALKTNGIDKGGIVNICSSGIPEIVYLVLACSKIGAAANFINPLFETQQKVDRINDTDSDTLFVMDKMYSYVKDVIGKTCLKRIIVIPATNSLPMAIRAAASVKDKPDKDIDDALKSGRFTQWNSYIKTGKNYQDNVAVQYQKDTPVIMVYSSGTTGASKGIVLTNNGVNSTILQYEKGLLSNKRGDRFLHNVPVWFSTGVVISLLMPLCFGAVCILEPVFSPKSFLNDIIKYKPNYALVATGLWLYLSERLSPNFDLSFLKCPITGGEQTLISTEIYLNEYLKEHKCNTNLQKGWGMCELGATATTTVFSEYNKPGSVGLPMPLAIVSAFDIDNGKELQYNERGEIRVQTPCRMKEYYNNPAETEEFFHADENGNVWGCTGDIGYVDEDGFVFVLGRASDYFISPDGERHYLFDTENVILENEFIDLCEVVTVASEKLNRELPVAHIVLKKNFNGSTDDLIKELDRLCGEQLPKYAVPVGYKIRERFAIKPSGKRDTLSLKEEHDDFMSVSDGKVSIINID